MKRYITNLLITFCMIFTALVLIYCFTFGTMPIYILQAIMFSSFFSSALTFLLYPKQTYSHKRILFQQILYIVLVMCMIMTTIIIVSGEISPLSFIVNFLVVMALFFLMKYLLYKKDQATAEEINELLQQRKKRTTS
ncbi:hypothetical protein P9F86_11740 [Bacillus altitudinis]|uniref:DUF3021 domain-containing protein n=1 Tax=Bacillus altitudinis TaxID=293387 RepID=A0ABV1S8W7_BACAB|nr:MULTISPECIES: hypothetical protein [Bacillus]MBX7001029.1 hypothetical protein [Bacillus aerophilus]KRV45864.1 hypothetical protein AS196_12230 [Bacillus sp. TH007]MBX7016391.1 hypothetical protein [Bacillus aerophilus]MCY7695114.1 hypothetical protein [Bacillus altitudinis]MDC7797599.1 hypothetical protein [Bacillus altitudinis]